MVQGQLLENSERGKILKDILFNYNPKTILEIGTWKGLGSTKCIVDNITENVEFISIESNKEFYDIAKQNLYNHTNKVKLLYGKIVDVSEINDFINGKNLTLEQTMWLKEDIENLNKCENILDILPKKIDFLLLDGGEFSTYPEWLKLKNRCKIVALDDNRELKTKQIHSELLNDNEYHLITQTDEGNGFSVFIKK